MAKARVWVATSKGLRVLTGRRRVIRAAPRWSLAGDMRDVAADRFGRVWAMSHDVDRTRRRKITTDNPSDARNDFSKLVILYPRDCE